MLTASHRSGIQGTSSTASRSKHPRTHRVQAAKDFRAQVVYNSGWEHAAAPRTVPDGPEHCSGLPVARYSPAQFADEPGDQWRLISQDGQEHVTPADLVQPFTWIALRKQA